MIKALRKLFGGIRMTWPRVIGFAVITAVYTAVMLLLPCTENTSFRDIGGDVPCWILFAVIIIANCPTAKESACKTFVFFLISQPLVYLFQVPFSELGWSLFRYYPPWFLITLLTFPGAWLGWHTRKKGILSGVILSPMLILLAFCGYTYLQITWHAFPHKLLSGIFCFAAIILLLAGILTENRQRITAVLLTALVTAALVWVTEQKSHSSFRCPLPETVSASEIAEVQIADPGTVTVDEELLKEDRLSVSVKAPCETELRLIGSDGAVLGLYQVHAYYDASGTLLIDCELKESQ